MQITDEMVRIALDLQHQDGTSPEDAMRAALEAALGVQIKQSVSIQDPRVSFEPDLPGMRADVVGENRQAHCRGNDGPQENHAGRRFIRGAALRGISNRVEAQICRRVIMRRPP